MSDHLYKAGVIWAVDGDFAANAYSRGHRWRFDGGIEVPASASPQVVPHHGVAAAVDPEEAFVAALASCHMLWFLDFARQAGLDVAGYEDTAEGRMERTAPGKFAITRVTLRPVVTLAAGPLPPADATGALHQRAHDACFIANSVRSDIVLQPEPVRIAATFER